jgi:hypothetical protein
MTTHPISLIAATITLTELVGACATYPPAQLLAARLTYADLSSGIAPSLAPAELSEAKTSLDLAEREFSTNGDTHLCRDDSYIAQNKLDLAAVAAQAEEDRRAIAEAATIEGGRGAQTMNSGAADFTPRYFEGDRSSAERADEEVAASPPRAPRPSPGRPSMAGSGWLSPP